MGSKLFVGGLPFSATEGELESVFGEHGSVESVRVIMDKITGQSRGFGFVDMSSQCEAEAAITALHSFSMGGQSITVNKAKTKMPSKMERGS